MLASNLSLDEPTLISAVFDGTFLSIFGKRYLRVARHAINQFLPSGSPASCYLASSLYMHALMRVQNDTKKSWVVGMCNAILKNRLNLIAK